MATHCDHAVAHDEPHDLQAALDRARERCSTGGQRWTAPRERVYELLLKAGAPVKAYDLMDAYQEGRAAKPPTVYRALEFLEHFGLVHRIASLNAYMACGSDDEDHAAAFLICDCCGSAEEFEPGRVTSASAAAAAHGFKARAIALEVRGLCQQCVH